ncbi:MAG: ThuA domain-containing protein [Bryobacterales bacterium]|nr:ThuA domain-containing protein [Bryobacterales bacterium]
MRTLVMAAALALPVAAQVTIPLFQAGKLRALIFSGRNNHDWRESTPFLRQLMVASGRFDVRVIEEPAGLTAETLAAYDVIVLDYNGPRWGAATERAVEEFVRSGKGMVVRHAAAYAFHGLPVLGDRHVRTTIVEPAWPEYARMTGSAWSLEDPRTGHGERHSFRVRFTDRDHPVAQGLAPEFWATDELYQNMRLRPEARVLAVAYADPKMGGTGKDEPVLWAVAYGKGRVFHSTLGHDLAAMWEPGFVTTFLRGAEWAASGAVTLPAWIDPARPQQRRTRVLVVTGGHDYDTSFYTLFEGYPDLAWDHAPSNREAYRRDLRPRYDVLVLYDMPQEIGETERQHLRDFAESGKGIVVLHHAIASYNSWEWYSKELVGGKYLLQPEAGRPGSTYKHDEEIFVYPVARHPVVSDVGRMHLWDETYKGLWISPEVKVLLRTDHPLSDGPVAWISPYPKSRVVYIQLGHDRLAHIHPGYRKLVKNAIDWAAGLR